MEVMNLSSETRYHEETPIYIVINSSLGLEPRSQGSHSPSRKSGTLPSALAQAMPSCVVHRHHACTHLHYIDGKSHLPVRAFRNAQRGKN